MHIAEVGSPPLPSLWSDSKQTKAPVSQGDVILGPHPPARASVGVIKLSHDSWKQFGSIHAMRHIMCMCNEKCVCVCVYHAQVKMLTRTNSSKVTQASKTHTRCHFFWLIFSLFFFLTFFVHDVFFSHSLHSWMQHWGVISQPRKLL